jgi:hypothetical protein
MSESHESHESHESAPSQSRVPDNLNPTVHVPKRLERESRLSGAGVGGDDDVAAMDDSIQDNFDDLEIFGEPFFFFFFGREIMLMIIIMIITIITIIMIIIIMIIMKGK